MSLVAAVISLTTLLSGPDAARPAARTGRRTGSRCPRGFMSDVGVDDDFIKTMREEITPGTSALS
jgi:hypothetical protein